MAQRSSAERGSTAGSIFSLLFFVCLWGGLLLSNIPAAVQALTIVLAAIFLAEGFAGCVYAFSLKGKNPAWIWVLLNGIVALVLGGMLIAKFPSDAEWVVGLLFGINSLFLGFSLIMFAVAAPKAQDS